jgi:Flp pilus assembly pilin Flp
MRNPTRPKASKEKKMRLPVPPRNTFRISAMANNSINYPPGGQVGEGREGCLKIKEKPGKCRKEFRTPIREAIIMKNLHRLISGFLADEKGENAVEYSILIALIAAVIFGAVQVFGNTVNEALFVTSNTLLFGS